jgi:hypothetical protein
MLSRPTAHLLIVAAEATQQTVADPGLGARVGVPPQWVLIVGWVIGIIALAILWAASRR